MDEPSALPPIENPVPPPPPSSLNTEVPPSSVKDAQPPLVAEQYRGNQYDVYSMLAATLGGTVLALCFSANVGFYCLPIVPLVLGIIAYRNARTSVDPQRTRNLALLGIAGGGLGTLLAICMIMFLVLYFGFIFLAIGGGIFSVPRR